MDTAEISSKGRMVVLDHTVVMGILNVTPDSFFDGGSYDGVEAQVKHAKRMASEGAEIIDVGGESSRPFSEPVDEKTELERVLPVIEALSADVDAMISVDTYKPAVASKALDAGAHMVNDIRGLEDGMCKVVADHGVPAVLMHMRGTPKDMQKDTSYGDFLEEVSGFLKERAENAKSLGVDQVILDPGIGFGKNLGQNLSLIANIKEFKSLGYPILMGPSRKSFIGEITGLEAADRLEGTIAAACACSLYGADMLRVHDVRQCKRALLVTDALKKKGGELT